MKTKILVIGACGQIGTELTKALEQRYGQEHIIAADVYHHVIGKKNYIKLDALDEEDIEKVVIERKITQIYLLAAMLSAKSEQNLDSAWKLNVHSLLSVLKIAYEQKLDKVFWPSSIAVFGPGSPKYNCPQKTTIEPNSVYGISKRAGEYWCNHHFEKFGVDVRSLRFPGLISYETQPGGGTTDYAVEIFHHALETGRYNCFLSEDTCLPMMYMPDAVRAIIELMDAPIEKISVRTSYNLASMSFAPCDLAAEIRKHIPGLKMAYQPDFRQAIADSWPASIKDEKARNDWGWKPGYGLEAMTRDMLENISRLNGITLPLSETRKGYMDFHID